MKKDSHSSKIKTSEDAAVQKMPCLSHFGESHCQHYFLVYHQPHVFDLTDLFRADDRKHRYKCVFTPFMSGEKFKLHLLNIT